MFVPADQTGCSSAAPEGCGCELHPAIAPTTNTPAAGIVLRASFVSWANIGSSASRGGAPAGPAVHARARLLSKVVRLHEDELDPTCEARLGRRCELRSALELLSRRQKVCAIDERPALVLSIGELETIGADGFGVRDQGVDP